MKRKQNGEEFATKNKSKKRKRLLAISALLAVVTLIASTFAWLTANDARINRVRSAYSSQDSVTLTEDFNPGPIEIVPGGETTKVVQVTNNSSAPVYVRASFEEVLKHLQTGAGGSAATIDKTAAWELGTNDTYATQGLRQDFPVLTPLEQVSGILPTTYKGRTLVGTTGTVGTPGVTTVTYADGSALPTGTVVYATGKVTKDPLDPSNDAKTTYVAEVEVFAPVKIFENEKDAKVTRYQLIKVATTDVKVDKTKAKADPTDVTKWGITFANNSLKYQVYGDATTPAKGGYTYDVANWADSGATEPPAGAVLDTAGIKNGALLLGTHGAVHNRDYDYTSDTLLGKAATANTPITEFAKQLGGSSIPTAVANAADKVKSARVGGSGDINLGYGAGFDLLPSTGAPAKGKWVYNPEDGWFYFSSPLASGATTGALLDKLTYGNKLGDKYSGAFFDLVVKIETVQYVADAVTESGGGAWNLPASGKTKQIRDALLDTVNNGPWK